MNHTHPIVAGPIAWVFVATPHPVLRVALVPMARGAVFRPHVDHAPVIEVRVYLAEAFLNDSAVNSGRG